MKKIIINAIICILIFLTGLIIRNWWDIGTIELETKINVLDALSLVATIVVGIYIAKILEKEVQDKRIEKDLYISKINSVEYILNTIESLIESSKDTEIQYGRIVNMMHRCRIKKSDVFNTLEKKKMDKLTTKIHEYNQKLKTDFQLLKKSLTETTVGGTRNPAVKLKNNIVSYSEERSLEILTQINSIESTLFELKIIINNL